PAAPARPRHPPVADDPRARRPDEPARAAGRPSPRVAAVAAHPRAGARVGRDPTGHGGAPPDAPAAPGGRRLGQDDRRGARRADSGRGRLPGRGDGADRNPRRAALHDLPPAPRAARCAGDPAHRVPQATRARGARPVVTVARTESKRREIYTFLRDEIARGRQAYVVYPLVEESEALDLKAATDMARRLAEDVFPDLSVGLMHGRLGFEEKDAIMRRFKAGEINILVSTTVIEVGIDVANASVMLVEHAERFGLSQLHQLRGRVGRGPWKSVCILLTSGRLTEEAQQRIAAMVSTNDGFRIAEVDLELRGPGEFFGTRQSGLPEFRTADLLRDAALLEEARREAQAIIAADPELRDPAHRALRASLLARWRGKLALASAG